MDNEKNHRKNADRSPEFGDEELGQVTGGTNAVDRPMEGWVSGSTTCKKCGGTFGYKYYYNICMSRYTDGKERDKPDFCPNCENPAENVGR